MAEKKPLLRHYLECATGGAAKFYDIQMKKGPDGMYETTARYGRLGTIGRTITKSNSTSLARGTNYANRLRNQKISKGYRVTATPKLPVKRAKRKKKEPPLTSSRISLMRFKDLLE